MYFKGRYIGKFKHRIITMTRASLVQRMRARVPGLWLCAGFPAFVVWIGISMGLCAGLHLQYEFSSELYSKVVRMTTLGAITATIFMRRGWLRCLLALIAGLTLGIGANQLDTARMERAQTIYVSDARYILSGSITNHPAIYNGRTEFTVVIDTLRLESDRTPLFRSGTVSCVSYKATPRTAPGKGDRVVMQGNYRFPQPRMNPGGWNERAAALARHGRGGFRIDSMLQHITAGSYGSRITQRIRAYTDTVLLSAIDADTRHLLRAAFMGQRSGISYSLSRWFKDAGLFHLLAISGLHVGILTVFVLALLSLCPIPVAVRNIITAGILWAYLWFVGFIPSLFRATLMATVFLCAALAGRRNTGINSLGLAGIVWLCFYPTSILSPGYQLSFGATAGILLLTPVFSLAKHIVHGATPFYSALKRIIDTASVSLAAFAATLPVLLFHFGSASAVSLVSNLCSVFIMTLAMWLFFAGLSLSWLVPPIGSLCVNFSSHVLNILIAVARVMADAPGHSFRTAWLTHLPFLSIYVLFFAGLAMCCKKHLMQYVAWSALVLFCTIPFVALKKTGADNTSILFFSHERYAVSAIVWPNRSAWIVSEATPNRFGDEYHSLIEPWLRNEPGVRITVLVLTTPQINLHHTLLPYLENGRLRHVITCDFEPYDKTFGYIKALCGEYGVKVRNVRKPTRFLPHERCSCEIGYVPSVSRLFRRGAVVRIAAPGHCVCIDYEACTGPAHGMPQWGRASADVVRFNRSTTTDAGGAKPVVRVAKAAVDSDHVSDSYDLLQYGALTCHVIPGKKMQISSMQHVVK